MESPSTVTPTWSAATKSFSFDPGAPVRSTEVSNDVEDSIAEMDRAGVGVRYVGERNADLRPR